ncbi:MAG: DUF2282 domain-containing protein [Gammaproteobacteria bacterium]
MTSHPLRNAALISSAIGALICGTASAQVHPEKPTYKYEKCYGIAKTGKNDCFFASNSCAGTVDRDNHPAAWLYMPKGTCLKITGASLEPPAK